MISRRTVLQAALATGALAAVESTIIPTSASAATPYRPTSISHVGDVGSPPTNLNYRMWNFSSGTTLSAALAKMGSNDCLVLPERSAPYLIDTSYGFAYPGTNRAMARAQAGVHGMGPGAVIKLSSSSFRQGRASGSSGNLNVLLQSARSGAYFGNFTMIGRDLGGCAMDAIKVTGSNTLVEGIHLIGAHRGWRNSPPGEAGGVVGHSGSNLKVRNCDIDCRDASSGARVGTSPIMLNNQSYPLIQDVYAHHSVSGSITAYRVTSPTLRRTRSEYLGSGSGGLNANNFNFEQNQGTVLLDNCTFICNYGTNTGVHLSVGSYTTPAKIRVVNPKHDAGPYKGVFAVNISKTYGGRTQTQKPSDISVVNSAGAPIAWRHN